MLLNGEVLRPVDVSRLERVFERDGVLRWADDNVIGNCRIGVSLNTLLQNLSTGKQDKKMTASLDLQGAIKLSELVRLYDGEAYILWFDGSRCEATIVLKQGCTPIDQLRAWAHALLLAQRTRMKRSERERQPKDDGSGSDDQVLLLADLRSTMEEVRKKFETDEERLRDVGWDLSVATLETRASMRVLIRSQKEK